MRLFNILFCLYFAFVRSVFGQTDDCVCVPFYLCTNGTLNTNGENIIDIRINANDCPSYLDFCCPTKEVLEKPKPKSPVIPPGCGHRNRNGVQYSITGATDNEAQFGEFPWVVAILRKDNETLSLQCGGSLIHPQVVLTAAHCVHFVEQMVVRAGEWDSKTTQEPLKHQDVKVSSAKVHPDFNSKNLKNDIALLFLETPVSLDDNHIGLACLPRQNNALSSNGCYVNGWGKNKFGKDAVFQNILKKIQLPVVAHEQCQDAFRKTRLGKYFILNESFVCAGGEEGKDACTGDGGGPLVCPSEEGRYEQVGIVSWGIGCGEKGVPGAYTNVGRFKNWIKKQTQTRSFTIQ
ncbi:phenoloxidase-activating factor 2 [Tribolium castaneum]|uniref:Phenoloxidase-activating factor 2 n=1 Tax=Tribolium castaneum TaxID=7070 RepID=D6WBS6_TRICA|nr:PREDICTED: serine protease 55 [Tribolium castaneum]XP_968341.1 PREDICTED: serine protease 55 [Tribolium castaneum]EEZ99307.1 serine protease H28 [Tribolium castaneum]|eukprot:XP_015840974.1 PREDICTED: serine protease 55 [Tribolium castaneum]